VSRDLWILLYEIILWVMFSMVTVLWGFYNFCCLIPVNCLFTNERQSALRLGGDFRKHALLKVSFKLNAISCIMLGLYLNFIRPCVSRLFYFMYLQ